MDDQFAKGRAFIFREGRLLERRLFSTCFEGAPPSGVVDALRGYANPDGGFGHGLEPDSRCPESLPIDVEVALQTLVAAKATDTHLLMAACGYLERVAEEAGSAGAVPLALPAIENYPRGAPAGGCAGGVQETHGCEIPNAHIVLYFARKRPIFSVMWP